MLRFEYDAVKTRYHSFVNNFLSCEENIKRTELPLNVWLIAVPDKDFNVMITCECRISGYGFEEWIAVVEEPNGEKSNFLLFEEEIENWLCEQRRIRGIH